MSLTHKQAADELAYARDRLRDALLRIQTHRIEKVVAMETPDVAAEIAWLLANGRHRVARHVLTLVEDFVCAEANLQHVLSRDVTEYETVVNTTPDAPPPYLAQP